MRVFKTTKAVLFFERLSWLCIMLGSIQMPLKLDIKCFKTERYGDDVWVSVLVGWLHECFTEELQVLRRRFVDWPLDTRLSHRSYEMQTPKVQHLESLESLLAFSSIFPNESHEDSVVLDIALDWHTIHFKENKALLISFGISSHEKFP